MLNAIILPVSVSINGAPLLFEEPQLINPKESNFLIVCHADVFDILSLSEINDTKLVTQSSLLSIKLKRIFFWPFFSVLLENLMSESRRLNLLIP